MRMNNVMGFLMIVFHGVMILFHTNASILCSINYMLTLRVVLFDSLSEGTL